MNQAFWRTAADMDGSGAATAWQEGLRAAGQAEGGEDAAMPPACRGPVARAEAPALSPWPEEFHPWHAERGGEWHRRGG